MKLYVSVCHDRHVDDEIIVWVNSKKAITHAIDFMHENTPRDAEIRKSNLSTYGYLYVAWCDATEHSAYVFETELME